MTLKSARPLCQGHPAWAKKARHLSNDFFAARTITFSPKTLPKTRASDPELLLQYGIVVKKKLGSAVLRNRIKRRLRAAFVALDALNPSVSCYTAHIVVVRSAAVAELPFCGVCHHLKGVLKFYD